MQAPGRGLQGKDHLQHGGCAPSPYMTGWGVPTSAQQVWGCEWRVQTPVHGQQKHKTCNSVEKLRGGPSEKQTRNSHLLWQSHLKAGS